MAGSHRTAPAEHWPHTPPKQPSDAQDAPLFAQWPVESHVCGVSESAGSHRSSLGVQTPQTPLLHTVVQTPVLLLTQVPDALHV